MHSNPWFFFMWMTFWVLKHTVCFIKYWPLIMQTMGNASWYLDINWLNVAIFPLLLHVAHYVLVKGSRGLMVESRTHNRKFVSSSLGPAGIVFGCSGCTVHSPPSIPRRGALEQGTEPPTAPRALQHKGLPIALGVCSRCVCSLLCVCTWMGKCRILSVSHHTWLYVM